MLLIHQGDSPTPRSPEAWGKLSEDEQRAIFAPSRQSARRRASRPGSAWTRRDGDDRRVQDGKTLTTDGPFVEIKESIGGYLLFEADDLDAAIELAARPGGAVGRRGRGASHRGVVAILEQVFRERVGTGARCPDRLRLCNGEQLAVRGEALPARLRGSRHERRDRLVLALGMGVTAAARSSNDHAVPPPQGPSAEEQRLQEELDALRERLDSVENEEPESSTRRPRHDRRNAEGLATQRLNPSSAQTQAPSTIRMRTPKTRGLTGSVKPTAMKTEFSTRLMLVMTAGTLALER